MGCYIMIGLTAIQQIAVIQVEQPTHFLYDSCMDIRNGYVEIQHRKMHDATVCHPDIRTDSQTRGVLTTRKTMVCLFCSCIKEFLYAGMGLTVAQNFLGIIRIVECRQHNRIPERQLVLFSEPHCPSEVGFLIRSPFLHSLLNQQLCRECMERETGYLRMPLLYL